MTKDGVARIAEWAQKLVDAHARRADTELFATLAEREAIEQLYSLIQLHTSGVISRKVAV